MAPISSSSLSIGTTICERAPASWAERGLFSSAAASRVWTTFFVRNIRSRGTPGGGVNDLCSRASTRARGAPTMGLRDERAVAITVQHAELGLANAKCILQHCVEHRLKLAGRT